MTSNSTDATAATATATAPRSPEPASDAVTWQVSISNLTPAGSQPFSPPVFVLHRPSVHVWQEGKIASHALAAVAEDANNAILVSALSKTAGVSDIFEANSGPIPPGASAQFTLQVRPGDRVSIMTMLVNTNDAFTGVDSLELHASPCTVRAIAYDAGSELNNELTAAIPGPAGGNFFVRDPEGDVIRPHEGITGRGDLDPAVHGWTEPVAEITFSRLD